ncbi:MAG: hypothetical protein JNL40_15545 [Cyclobacteriaceae bacterium]|nr:hypothetical protein [Cyclobacteriaceae bacterium]
MILLLILLSIHHPVRGQATIDTSTKLPWPNDLSFSYYRMNIDRIAPQDAFGFNAEYYIGNRWGIEWSFVVSEQYIQFGGGSFFTPIAIWFHNKNIVRSGTLFIFSMALLSALEHTNYHIPLARGIELVPYVSVLKGLYQSKDYDAEIAGFWSGGLRLSFIVRRTVFLNISAEGGKLYEPGTPAIVQYGINLGYIFRGREFDL